jgi:enterochelin esterase family protein
VKIRCTQPIFAVLCVGKLLAGCAVAMPPQDASTRQAVKVDSKTLDAYVGQYELAPNVLLSLRREGSFLMANVTGQPWLAVYAESETKFYWKVVDAQFTIQLDKDGNVEGLLFEQGAAKLKARKISSAVPPAAELREPDAVIESPRLVALTGELKSGNRDALEKWWAAMRDKGPLIEPLGNVNPLSRVTFLWRGDELTHRVLLVGGLPTPAEDKWLTRLADTDLWFRTETIPNDARFAYWFQINRPVSMPRSDDPAGQAKVLENAPFRADPLNPRMMILQGMMPASLLELPAAPPQPWLERLPGVPQGTLKEQKFTSKPLNGERTVTIYTPENYASLPDRCGLLVLFDGAYYQDGEMIPAPVILDNLIAKKKIPPLVAVFVKHEPPTRNKDLSCSELFATFLIDELMPWIHGNYMVSKAPESTIVGGLSMGGLMASYCGLRHPEVFGNVLSQSGAFSWYPGGLERDARDVPDQETDWLTRQFVAESRRDVRFYLEIGRFEDGGFASPLAATRRFRDVLKSKGYSVHYSEYNGGHDYVSWRGSFADGLMALVGVRDKE